MTGLAWVYGGKALWKAGRQWDRQRHGSGAKGKHRQQASALISLTSPRGVTKRWRQPLIPSCHLEQYGGNLPKSWGGPMALRAEVVVFTQIYEWVVRAKDESQLPSCTARRQQAAAYQQRCWAAQISIKKAENKLHTRGWYLHKHTHIHGTKAQ